MATQAQTARAALKAKARRLANEKPGKVDASSYSIPDDMHADVKTGMRPISKRAYKRGGKVDMGPEGAKAQVRADRVQRKSGGRIADELVNRNVKEANQSREGIKHVGGMKSGGRAEKAGGGAGLLERIKEKLGQRGSLPAMPPGPSSAEIRRGQEERAKSRKVIKRDPDFDDTPAAFPVSFKKSVIRGAKGRMESGPMKQVPIPPPEREEVVPYQDEKALNASNAARLADWQTRKAAPRSEPDDTRATLAGLGMMKRGGRTKKWLGGPMDERMGLVKQRALETTGGSGVPLKKGGRAAKQEGGSTLTGLPLSEAAKARIEGERRIEEALKSNERIKAGDMTGVALAPEAEQPIPLPQKNGGAAKHAKDCVCKACGGRAARASGGRAKGKTNINIIISAGQKAPQDGAMMPPGGLPPGGPPVPPPGIPVPVGAPPGAGAPMPMPMPGPQGPPGPPGGLPPHLMGRKSGGRVYRSYKDMDAGAGGAEGRLEKTEIAERQSKRG